MFIQISEPSWIKLCTEKFGFQDSWFCFISKVTLKKRNEEKVSRGHAAMTCVITGTCFTTINATLDS